MPANKRKRNSRTIILGTKLAKLEVGPEKSPIFVHEDLFCSRSVALKKLFQKCRKPFSADDECAVCTEGLDPEKRVILHCKACGKNIHEECIEDWWKTTAKTCPMCRAKWTKEEQDVMQTAQFPELDPTAFNLYVRWVNQDAAFQEWDEKEETIDDRVLLLFKAYSVGDKLVDCSFQTAVQMQIIEDVKRSRRCIGFEVLDYVYGLEDPITRDLLQYFVVDVFVVKAGISDPYLVPLQEKPWAMEFLIRFAEGLVEQHSGKRPQSFDDIVWLWHDSDSEQSDEDGIETESDSERDAESDTQSDA